MEVVRIAALGAVLSGPVHAGQPIYESLVECAVMIELLISEQTPTPGESELLDVFHNGAVQMRLEAAQVKGAHYVEQTARAKREVWHRRWDEKGWDNPANRQELGD